MNVSSITSELRRAALCLAALPVLWSVLGAWRTATGDGFLTLHFGTAYIARWMLLIVGAAVVVGTLSTWRRSAIALWTASTLALVSFAALSGSLRSLLGALLTTSAGLSLGARIRRACGSRTARTNPLVDLAVGFAALQSTLFLVGWAGLLRLPVGLTVLAIGAIGLPATAKQVTQAVGPALSDRSARFFVGTVACLMAPVWVWASAPDLQFDAVYAKAWLPQVWARTGSTGLLTDHPVLGTVGTDLTLAVPGHMIGGSGTGQFLQAFCGLIVILSPWWLMRSISRGEIVWAGFVSLAIATCSHLVWQMATAYDDLIVTVEFLAVLMLAFPPKEPSEDTTSGRSGLLKALPLGALIGALVASKLYLIPFAGVVFIVWSLHRPIRQAALCAVSGVAAAGPLFLMRWVDTGNPFFPQFNGMFKSEYFAPVNTNWNMPYDHRSGLLDALALPVRAAVTPWSFVEVVPGGGLGLLVLGFGMLGVGLLFGVDRRIPIVLMVWLAMWWMQLRYLRYALPLLIAGVLLVRFRQSVPETRSLMRGGRWSVLAIPAVSGVLIAISVWPTAASFWNIPERLPIKVATGRESRGQYLRRSVLAYPAFDFLNQRANPGDRIVGSPLVARVLMDERLDISPAWEAEAQIRLPRNNDKLPTGATLVDRYRAVGFEWISVMAIERLGGSPTMDSSLVQFPNRLVWSGNGIEIYRLHDPAGGTTQTCTATPGEPSICGGRTELDLEGGILAVTGGCSGDLIQASATPADPSIPIDTTETHGTDLLSFNRMNTAALVILAQSRTGPGTRIAFTGLAPDKPVSVSVRSDSAC